MREVLSVLRGLFPGRAELDLTLITGSLVGDAGPGCRGEMGSRISELPLCQRVSRELDLCYSVMGSLFQCGFRQTLFSIQLMHYADLYTATCLNFLYHPLSSLYRAASELVGPCGTSLASLNLHPRRTHGCLALPRAFEVTRPPSPISRHKWAKPLQITVCLIKNALEGLWFYR